MVGTMGIFSSEKRKSSANVTTKVMGDFDDPLPGIVAGSAVTNTDIVQSITEYFIDGYYSKSEQYFRYGRDHYERGLPTSYEVFNNPNYPEIRRIIEANENSKISFGYAYLGSDYDKHYVAQYLQDNRAYNSVTGEVGIVPPGGTPGSPVYFHSSTAAVDELSTVIHYAYGPGSAVSVPAMDETIPLPYKTFLVYQVEYQLVNSDLQASGIPKYWMYVKGTNTYPVLETTPDTEIGTSNYYPIVPFYEDKTELGDPSNAGTPLYDTSVKLMKKLGFSYADMFESISEGTEESIGKDKGLYSYFHLGVEVTAGILPNYETATADEKLEFLKINQASIHYLIDYFVLISLKMVSSKFQYDAYLANPKKVVQPKETEIGISDGEFKYVINYKYITVERFTGSIGDIGWCTSEIDPESREGINTGLEEGYYSIYQTTKLIYRKQETATTYIQVVVCGMRQQSILFNDLGSLTYADDALREEDPSIITVPLDRDLVKNTPNRYRNRLIHAAMCFTFNSYSIQEIKWYQQNAWKTVFNAVAIILAVPSGGQSFAWAQVFTITTLKAAAQALIVMYLKYLIFNEITKYISKKFGVEAAFIFAAALMAYGKFAKMGKVPGMPWAAELVSVGSSIWSSNNKFIQDSLVDLQKDYAKLETEANKQQEELNRAYALLDHHDVLDPWLFVNPLPDLQFSQTASEFIDLRAHTSNPGIASLQAPSSYVDLMLTLPTIDDTLTNS